MDKKEKKEVKSYQPVNFYQKIPKQLLEPSKNPHFDKHILKEARNEPQFVVDGFDRSDMDQGQIGNCW